MDISFHLNSIQPPSYGNYTVCCRILHMTMQELFCEQQHGHKYREENGQKDDKSLVDRV